MTGKLGLALARQIIERLGQCFYRLAEPSISTAFWKVHGGLTPNQAATVFLPSPI